MSRMKFMNTCIDNLTMNEALDRIDQLIHQRQSCYAVTPNVDHIVRLEKDARLREVYRHADLILTDGKPLIWISRLYKTPIKEKVSGSDLFPLLCERAAKAGYRLFLLGAAEGVAAAAAQRLTRRYPGLRIAGTYSPPYGFENREEEICKAITLVQEAKPDILIVGLGCPKQEYFIYDHLHELDVPLSLGLGASLDFEAGHVKRAPKWMSNCGLEWLYRLLQEPTRMAKRYLVDDMQIFPLIFKYRPKKGQTKNNENCN